VVLDRIAFTGADGAVYTVRPDGTALRRVSQDPADITVGVFSSSYSWPVWSPDGRHLLITGINNDISGGFETSLLRVPAAGGATPELLYLDVPGNTGIGGIAHYASWSPDSNKIALIANIGDGLTTFLLDRERGFSGQSVSNGGPVYLDWSADGTRMLVHTDERLALHLFGSDGRRASTTAIGTGSVSYRAPDFSPASDEYLYVDTVEGVRSVFIGTPGADPVALTSGDVSSAMKWSPDGRLIALARSVRSGVYQRLDILRHDGSTAVPTIERDLLAFWWSPDGGKILAVLTPEDGGEDEVTLATVDVASGTLSEIGLFAPSAETRFVIEFFDQYANDHRIWSPDSRMVTLAGLLRGDLEESAVSGMPGAPATSPSASVWAFDVTGAEPPLSVGAGVFATWSPR
jgi:TolB protein